MKVLTRQLGFLGYVMRRQGFENLRLTGKIEETRVRGRQQMKYPDSVCRRMELRMSPIELLKYTQDRTICKSMVIDVTRDRTPR